MYTVYMYVIYVYHVCADIDYQHSVCVGVYMSALEPNYIFRIDLIKKKNKKP